MTKPYERLSRVYDSGWSDFSLQYIDWVNKLLAERGVVKGRILDLACGTGILAIGLARCGHTVYGIDVSKEMIQKARAKAVGLSDISFGVQDMVRFRVNTRFDLVACTFDSINYLCNIKQVGRMLLRAASVLSEHGLFIFDSNTRKLYQSHSNETIKQELDGEAFIQYCRYDSTRNLATTTFSFSDGSYEIHRQRAYDYEDLSPLLIAASFHTVHLFSWFDMLPYSSETAKLFCVTEKRG